MAHFGQHVFSPRIFDALDYLIKNDIREKGEFQLTAAQEHLRQQTDNRPAAANLIEGSLQQVIEFLDRLTYGSASTPGLGEAHAAWRERVIASRGHLSRSEPNLKDHRQ